MNAQDSDGEDWHSRLVCGAGDVELGRAVGAALQDLLDHDAALLVADVHEQAITAALAKYLAPHFPDWNVDVEYNRDGHEIKTSNGVMVKPDVIVHRRGTPDNLLVIEAKKSSSQEPDSSDVAKLAGYKSFELGYRHALFVKFSVGDRETGIERLEWV